jgi:ferritin
MNRTLLTLIAALALIAPAFLASAADDSNSPEMKMREALRNTMIQLRDASAKNDDLQAQLTDLQSQKDALTAQIAELAKRSAAEKDADTKAINVLKTQVSDQQDSIAELQKNLDAWKKSQRDITKVAQDTEAKRAKLADLAIHLQRIVDDQKRKNDAMYKIGMDVLDRYEKFGLGQALFAKEPFVGITRTKFESLVQDSEDQLTDQKITDQPAPTQKSKPQ